MKKKEVLNIIQSATKAVEDFFSIPKESTELVFESSKVKDGDQVLNYASLEVGATVEVSTSEGSEVAPDGAYDLENGVSFTVKDGVISELKDEAKPNEELAETPDEESEIKEKEEDKLEAPVDSPLQAEVDTLKAKIEQLETAITEILKGMEASASKEDFSALTSEIKGLNQAVNILANTPEEFSKVDTSNEAIDEKATKLADLASIMGNRK